MLKQIKLSPTRTLIAAATLAFNVFASGAAQADEVAPQLSIAATFLNLYHDDQVVVDGCYVVTQAVDGAFSCTTNSGNPLNGKITGITNQFGSVTGHKLTFTIRTSSTIIESYSGAIKRVGAYGYLFSAGTFQRTEQKTHRLGLTISYTSGPFPFKMNHYSIGG